MNPIKIDEAALVMRRAAPLPRYTSYPTANHFVPTVGPADYRKWLGALEDDAALSLYVHIPYCNDLCWYCACSTKATHRYEPVARYLETLQCEIASVAALLPRRHHVTHIHWGGGSPDILSAPDIARLGDTLRRNFQFDDAPEFAIEIDPRLMTEAKADVMVGIGINRISIGVQDFDPAVQVAIGRSQGYEVTKATVDMFRARDVASVNFDLVYGLPQQTMQSLSRTIEQVLELSPDRIAMFGYAHLPWKAPNQKLIDEKTLPGPIERFKMARQVTTQLEDADYRQLGLDHFARYDDSLATKPLHRNFQGYTTDRTNALIGLGASAIGKLPQGYMQNAVAAADYASRIDQGGLATVRGRALTPDDRLRAFVIERLMCDFEFSAAAVMRNFDDASSALLDEADAIVAEDGDGFVESTTTGFRLTSLGRPFVRNICARFDAYLKVAAGQHSLSV
ncbi:oxygen-independent coproporphyrinogen III oxidase [Tardiphaga sp.]|uniref:oxygen-independent coproporphyrinogen III oxidase n=1 Tax=Tardiphaga sp. TaxID=1926292 RepID=UPI00261BD3D5|nr:oxygen-independent coproporphyrinogen III oxidase [Tardiphaga sp.]